MLDKKLLSLTLDDFRIIFHLPQATDNNHDSFVPPPSFLDMVPFYKNELGFTMELKTSSSFKTTSLLQPWQTLCKIFSKCLTTRITGWDQPPLQIMKMMTPSTPRSPNPKVDTGESSAPKWLTMIHFCIPHRRSTRLTPPAPVPTVDKADEMVLQDTLQHLASEEIEKMVDKPKNVIDDSPIPRNDDQNIPNISLEPRSDKESPEVEITNVVIPVNVNEEEEDITDEVYELKQREKGKIIEESRSTPSPTPIRSPRIHTDLVSLDTEKLQELTETDTTPTPSSSLLNTKLSTTNRLLSLFKAKPARFKRYKSFFQEVMVQSLPTMVDKYIKEQVEKQQNKEETDKMIAKAMLQERRRLQAEISSQIQQAIDNNIPSLVDASVRNYMSGHILHVHPAQPQTTSIPEQQYQLYLKLLEELLSFAQEIRKTLMMKLLLRGRIVQIGSNQKQVDDCDFWTESYASDDDEIPTKQVSQDIMKEVSLTINEAELKKIADEMLRQRCLKSYNNDFKYGYKQRDLTKDEVEYLKLFEEEIEVRLKYRNQMRRREMYVNGRPLEPRRERLE
ncbi:hypothetical protein Tco_0928604 [Tanacetum coccineum]